jgi:RNA polymerase sigma-70 factor (ECF subfamily)
MTDDIADSTPGPETSTAVRRNLERLRAALQQLPEADRSVLIMRAYDELSYEDIAVAMGMSSGAARVKAHRARARLAELLSKEAS